MILPDGAMELMINLGDPQKLCARDNPAKHTIFRQSWISGERTTPIVIDEIGYVHLVGVRLRAGGAWPLIGDTIFVLFFFERSTAPFWFDALAAAALMICTVGGGFLREQWRTRTAGA